jgi:hypothetical protein
MSTHVAARNNTHNTGLIALNKWAEQIGITPITAWRMRKKGWLKTVNICGRVYISAEAIQDFTRRAEAGDFAQEHKAPGRRAC